jgi:hypothetical protein
MSVKMRQMVEREIAQQFIKDALAAGYTLEVNDGEENTYKGTDADAILAAMFTTDEDYLFLYLPALANRSGKADGWVRFIYGNDGWDVICDYTTNLEHLMNNVNAISDKYSD